MNQDQNDENFKNLKTPKSCYICIHCHFKTVYKESFERHKRIHTGEKPYWCGACQVRFSQWTGLDFHVKKKHNNDRHFFRSDKVPMWVKENDENVGLQPLNHKIDSKPLIKMGKVTAGGRQFKCEICSFQTRYRVSLVRHRVLHSRQKPYYCSKCNERFSQYTAAYKHVHISHGGDMKLLCKDDKLEITMDNVDAKDFAPDYQEKNKSIKRLTKKTLNGVDVKKTKRKIFHCPFCEFSTFHSSSMSVHKRRHLNVKFSCKFCKNKFFSPSALRHHTNHKHPDQLNSDINLELTSSTNALKITPRDGNECENSNNQGIEIKSTENISSLQSSNEQYGMKRLQEFEFTTNKPEFPSGNNRRLIDLLKVLKLSSLQMFGELQREALKMQRYVDSLVEQLKTAHVEINEVNNNLITTKQELQNAVSEVDKLKVQLHDLEKKPVHCKQEPKEDKENEAANKPQEILKNDLETSITKDLQVNGRSESEKYKPVSLERESQNSYISNGNIIMTEQLQKLRSDVITLLNMLSPELNADSTNVDGLLKQIISKGLEN